MTAGREPGNGVPAFAGTTFVTFAGTTFVNKAPG